MRAQDEHPRVEIPRQRRASGLPDSATVPSPAAADAAVAGVRRMPLTPATLAAVQRCAGNAAAASLLAQQPGVQPGQRPEAQQSAPAASSPVPLQRWTSGTMSGDDPVYTPDGGRAGEVEVHNLRGQPLGMGANSPAVAPIGWDTIVGEGFALGGQKPANAHYNAVRMHLWNGRLGGSGSDFRNLAPGPGQINSEMSASAETPVKNLVTAGERVWLRTRVAYQSAPANAGDLTSVIPNRIRVDWGVEGQPASNGTWSADIFFPIAPLDAGQQRVYQNWSTGPAALVADLAGKTGQVRAQALTLLPTTALKQAVFAAFPPLFHGLAAAEQGAFYGLLHAAGGEAQATAFAASIAQNDEQTVSYAVLPLYHGGLPDVAARLFSTQVATAARQRQQLIDFKTDLVVPAGAAAQQIARYDYTVFSYYAAEDRAALMTAMVADRTINDFLTRVCRNGRIALQELDAWAGRVAGADEAARRALVKSSPIDPDLRRKYGAMLDAERASKIYRAGRSHRFAPY